MKQAEKQAIVQEMADRFSRAKAALLTNFVGLKVEQMTGLRAELTKKGLDYKVVKNTLLRRAVDGTECAPLVDGLVGPNGVALSYDDPVELAKVLTAFAKDHPKFEIKGGVLEGKLIQADQVAALSKLPGREELLAMLLGAMNGVPRNLVSVLAAVPRGLVTALSAIRDQKAEAGEN